MHIIGELEKPVIIIIEVFSFFFKHSTVLKKKTMAMISQRKHLLHPYLIQYYITVYELIIKYILCRCIVYIELSLNHSPFPESFDCHTDGGNIVTKMSVIYFV